MSDKKQRGVSGSTVGENECYYQMPKVLCTDEKYKKLSNDAKVLYTLMLDRCKISRLNDWGDAEGKIYIYYSYEEIMKILGRGREKCAKIIGELRQVGLIRKKHQGLGKPDIIYVKALIPLGENEEITENETADNKKLEMEKFENRTAGNAKNETAKVRESNVNKNNDNKIEYKNQSIVRESGGWDRSDVEETLNLIKENIEYEFYTSEDKSGAEYWKELYGLIEDVLYRRNKTVKIGESIYPYEVVKSRFLKLNSANIKYVIHCLQSNTGEIRNIRNYMIAALYNAPTTMDCYYTQRVHHDLYTAP